MQANGKEQWFDVSRTMYLKNARGSVDKHQVIGETSRSWLTGRCSNATRWAKKEYTVTTEEEYRMCLWVDSNRYGIAQQIQWGRGVSAAMLAEIAELIGYELKAPALGVEPANEGER